MAKPNLVCSNPHENQASGADVIKAPIKASGWEKRRGNYWNWGFLFPLKVTGKNYASGTVINKSILSFGWADLSPLQLLRLQCSLFHLHASEF